MPKARFKPAFPMKSQVDGGAIRFQDIIQEVSYHGQSNNLNINCSEKLKGLLKLISFTDATDETY